MKRSVTPDENLTGWNHYLGLFMNRRQIIIYCPQLGKTSEVHLNEYISVRSPPLKDLTGWLHWKKTIKWAYFERIAQKGQRKMIIYLNA